MHSSKHLTIALVLVTFGSSLSASRSLAADDADAQPSRILIEYIAPKSPEHQEIYEIVKERRALEKLQEIYGAFRLPIDLTLRTVDCDGVSNAWYQRGRVSVCYEYLSDIRKMMPQDDNAVGITPADAVAGQFFYVVSHEFGHAMFDILNVPVFGRPEDAADQFATYIILQFGKDQARRLIRGAAYSYRSYLRKPQVTAPLAAFSNTHSPPPVRFYNLICLAYGADPVIFADFATEGYLPKERSGSCQGEYREVAFAFNKLIAPHLDKSIAQSAMQKSWLPDVELSTRRQ